MFWERLCLFYRLESALRFMGHLLSPLHSREFTVWPFKKWEIVLTFLEEEKILQIFQFLFVMHKSYRVWQYTINSCFCVINVVFASMELLWHGWCEILDQVRIWGVWGMDGQWTLVGLNGISWEIPNEIDSNGLKLHEILKNPKASQVEGCIVMQH